MKIGYLEITGIKKVVVEQKVVWVKHKDRWIKYIGDDIKGGKSELEMHDYLNGMYWAKKLSTKDNKTSNKYGLWVSGDTINVKRNEDEPVKPKPEKKNKVPKSYDSKKMMAKAKNDKKSKKKKSKKK